MQSVPWRPRQNGWFTVTVELPRMANVEDPLNILEFTSQMPSFQHMFRNMEDVYFHRLSVSTSDRAVLAEVRSSILLR